METDKTGQPASKRVRIFWPLLSVGCALLSLSFARHVKIGYVNLRKHNRDLERAFSQAKTAEDYALIYWHNELAPPDRFIPALFWFFGSSATCVYAGMKSIEPEKDTTVPDVKEE